jgi:hypothetical protein
MMEQTGREFHGTSSKEAAPAVLFWQTDTLNRFCLETKNSLRILNSLSSKGDAARKLQPLRQIRSLMVAGFPGFPNEL